MSAAGAAVTPTPTAASDDGAKKQAHQGPRRIIAVGGGKGGVGKSVLVSNLAVAFAQRGFRVIAIDCDLGSANLHTMLGVTRPQATLTQLFTKEIDHLSDAVLPTRIPGLNLIAGAGAIPGAANIHHAQKQKMLRHIGKLPADVVLLDVGAGTAFNTVDIFNIADLRIVVTTPQLTSIQNAYGFVKASAHRMARSLAENADERAAFDAEARPDETETLAAFIKRIEKHAPAYAQRIRHRMHNYAACIVGNQLHESREVNVLHAVTRMISDFLGLRVPVISSMAHSPHIHHSVNQRKPLVLTHPYEPNAQQVRRMLEHILRVDVQSLRQQKMGDLDRLLQVSPNDARNDDGDAELNAPLARFERRSERYELRMTGKLLTDDDVHTAQVNEVSEHGALIQLDLDMQMNDSFEFFFDEEPETIYAAEVRSLRGPGLYGVEFVQRTIDPAVIDAWREAFAADAPASQE